MEHQGSEGRNVDRGHFPSPPPRAWPWVQGCFSLGPQDLRPWWASPSPGPHNTLESDRRLGLAEGTGGPLPGIPPRVAVSSVKYGFQIAHFLVVLLFKG